MSGATSDGTSVYTVEALGSEPTVVINNSAMANFRPLRNVFRGTQLSVVRGLVDSAIQQGNEVVQPLGEPAASTLGKFAEAVPIVGPSRIVHGVRLRFGDGHGDAMPQMAGYEWELLVDGGTVPPRLHLTPAAMNLLAISEDQRDRSVYGPVDMYAKVALLADIVRMWEAVNNAGPGYAGQGSFVLRIPDDEGVSETLRVVHYSERYVDTPAGPRIRGFFEDISGVSDPARTRLSLLDGSTGRHLLAELGVFGAIVDHRFLKAPTVLRWLTPWVPGIGHGVSTGQMPGFHPDEYVRFPEMLERSAHGPVRDSVRVRRAGGGWMRMKFTATHIDALAAPTIGVAIITPDEVDDQPS